MNKLFKHTLAAALLGASSISGLTAQAVAAPQHTINVVHLSNENDEDFDGAMVFKDYVEARSNGAIEVKVFPGGQLCTKDVECIEALQANLIQVFQTTTGGIGSVMPELQVVDLPYMFSNDRVAECVFEGPFQSKIRKDTLAKTGTMRLMSVGNTGGWRNFATTSKLIKSPADMNGMKLRVPQSPILIELVKSLGASATPIAWPEVYTSLATGVVEGVNNGITDITGMKFHEHLKYLTLDGHAYMTSFWWMNDEAYKGMSPELQRVVVDGFDALAKTTQVFPKRRAIEGYQEFVKAGGTIYTPNAEEMAQFKSAVQPVWKWFEEKYGNEWIAAAQAAAKTCEDDLNAQFQADFQ